MFVPINRIRVYLGDVWCRTRKTLFSAEDAIQRFDIVRRGNKYVRLQVCRVTSEKLKVDFITLFR